MRRACYLPAVLLVACVIGSPPAEAALGIGVSTTTVALSLKPGQTATGTGSILVTAGLSTWQMSVADTTGNAGHLHKSALCPSYAETQTANTLTIRASGPLSSSTGTKTVGAMAQTLASGTVGDTLTVTLGLAVGASEALPLGCTYSTTLTYTVQ